MKTTVAENVKEAVMSNLGAKRNLSEALEGAFKEGGFEEDLRPSYFSAATVSYVLRENGLGVNRVKVENALDMSNMFTSFENGWYSYNG